MHKWPRILLIICLLLVAVTVAQVKQVSPAELTGPDLTFNSNTVLASITLKADENQINLIREGIWKEFIFHVDLFRRWNVWPDEFITGIKVKRDISANTVKGEYKVATETEGVYSEKRFQSFNEMIAWALLVRDISFPLKDLPTDGTYFIKTTVESLNQDPPQVLSYILFFVNDKDFVIKKDSESFTVRGR